MNIAVGIATTGRPDILREALFELARQHRLPNEVVLCPASESDVCKEQFSVLPYPVKCVFASKGLTRQRNAILRALRCDVVVFFDDDFFPAPDFLAEVERLMRAETDVVVATGSLIADGVHGPGIASDTARELIKEASSSASEHLETTYGGYGCNFAVRMEPARRYGIQFDEELPLYGWQEDIDFSRQLAPYGRIVRTGRLRGVHLGTKQGRTSGFRFGYSQVANPIYLIRKGTMSVSYGVRLLLKNVIANSLRCLWPEPHIDRIGRAKGNIVAFSHLFRRRIHPRRILDYD